MEWLLLGVFIVSSFLHVQYMRRAVNQARELVRVLPSSDAPVYDALGRPAPIPSRAMLPTTWFKAHGLMNRVRTHASTQRLMRTQTKKNCSDFVKGYAWLAANLALLAWTLMRLTAE